MSRFEVAKHSFVPKHIKLNEKEVEEVLKKYNIDQKQLPSIIKSDPAIKEMKLQAGDVVKIIRKSPVAGNVEFYRVVANA